MISSIKLGERKSLFMQGFDMLADSLEAMNAIPIKPLYWGETTDYTYIPANPVYKNAYEWNKRFLVLWGGRGSGKTQFAVQKIVEKCCKRKRKVFVFRKVDASIKDTIYSEYKTYCEDNVTNVKFRLNPREIEFPNGSKIIFKGFDDPQKAGKGLEGVNDIHIEEAFEFTLEDFTMLDNSLRGKKNVLEDSQILLTFNPEHQASWLKGYFFDEPDEFVKEELYEINTTFRDNIFLDEKTIKKFETTTNSRSKVDRDGLWGGDITGACWTYDLIEKQRLKKHEVSFKHFIAFVVSIDPSVSEGDKSDGHGLIIAGIRKDGHVYVLEDLSRKGSINDISELVVKKADLYSSLYGVPVFTCAEVNNGGKWIKGNLDATYLRLFQKRVVKQKQNPYRPVHAVKKKIERASILSQWYETEHIWHVGEFPHLELQMTTFTGSPKDKSPNNLDALGHGVMVLNKYWNSYLERRR